MLFNFKRSNRATMLYVTVVVLVVSSITFLVEINHNTNKVLKKITIGQTIIHVEEAVTPEEQALGLGERNNLVQDHGMLFRFATPSQPKFWMKNMRFPLDFIWINNGKVVDLSENIATSSSGTTDDKLPLISPIIEVNEVIEVNAGFVTDNQISIGNKVEGL